MVVVAEQLLLVMVVLVDLVAELDKTVVDLGEAPHYLDIHLYNLV